MADILVSVLPSFHPSLTSWVPGETPMSTWPAVSAALLTYLVVIFSLQELMRDRPAFKLKTAFRVHNAVLSLGSLVLGALILEEVAKLWFNVGLFDSLCAEASWTRRLEFYYMVNYYFKYIEFLDTVFLVLKKRPLSFLHVFHHASTAFLAFVGHEAGVSGIWLAVCINLGVHVVMYYYYFVSAGGAKPWWKRHLTTVQMVQFVIDITALSFGMYQQIAFRHWSFLPHIGDCAGDMSTAVFGGLLIVSFLGLFSNFYTQTYTKADGIKKDKVANANGKAEVAHTNGKAKDL